MKIRFLILFLGVYSLANAQSVVHSVNSGSIIASMAALSIGEIVVNPVNQNQSYSGLIGILTQINGQNLEVTHFEIANNLTVYPNPTVSKIYFETTDNLQAEKISVYDNLGKLVSNNQLNTDNSLDLSALQSGIYLIKFSNKTYKSFKIIKK